MERIKKNILKKKIIELVDNFGLKNQMIYEEIVKASICNGEAFSEYKDYFKDQEVVLCGAGPSLYDYRIIANLPHIALNRAIQRKDIKYDFFIADDWEGIHWYADEIIHYPCTKFLGMHTEASSVSIPESFIRDCNGKKFYTDLAMVHDGFKSRFVCDIDKGSIGNMPNIALLAMQIILFMRPKKIYLVGCDATSAGHYNEANLEKNIIQYHNKMLSYAVSGDAVIKKWLELKEFKEIYYPDVEIVSINPKGLIGIFKDSYQ